ncbi:MAG: NAD(P)/FAD-dependent oxidoreductase [Spirochaetia bacterium]|jgi:NADH dehydrogenase|nr:NAD(P)/FAD-dependent oxidoreductase [Spirochaetia bacterium]
MTGTKKILILGGGYGGVGVGKILEKHFRKQANIQITLVDKKPFHTLMTELHEVAGWRTEPESIQVSFKKIFGTKKIEVVLDEITSVDFKAKKAVGKARTYEFDYIIVGAGAEPEYFNIPGVKENSFSLWSFEDAMRIRHHVEDVFARAAEETDPEVRKRLLTFVVAGAGFTGIEMIGELLEYRDVMCKKYYLNRSETRVINIEALPSILPILEESLRVRAEKYLAKMGCELMLNASIIGAEPGKVLCKDGKVFETDTFIWTCGVKGSSFAAGLDLPKGERGRGRLQVDAELKSPDYPYVYVVGDNAFFLENGKPLPQIVEAAHQMAEVVAKNIIADVEGNPERHAFKSNFHGFMVSIGGRYGVANAGGIKCSGFMALAMKHIINMGYLLSIAGINQVWEYVKHEFLDIKNRRSFIGGFAAHKVRGYWPLLLRMWLGLMWVIGGVNKIGEGWLAWSEGSKSGWMFSSGVIQKGVPIVEAVSAASDAGDWAEPIVEATAAASDAVVETVSIVADGATRAFGEVWDLTKPIFDFNGVVSTWFRTTFMDGMFAFLPYQGFQAMIVVTEIAIGLAIFGGFFTWWAAMASIAMCVVFTLSGMFAWDQLWFVFAAILMLGGAGRSFGLDYWSVPFFKKWWNGTKFARKWHFYADDPTK